jgi:hypothetical protein
MYESLPNWASFCQWFVLGLWIKLLKLFSSGQLLFLLVWLPLSFSPQRLLFDLPFPLSEVCSWQFMCG